MALINVVVVFSAISMLTAFIVAVESEKVTFKTAIFVYFYVTIHSFFISRMSFCRI